MNDISFQKHLSSVILDNKYDRFVKNKKAGTLNTNSLYKISHSNKLFKKREARQNKSYSVSLVVDCSGSMSGDKIKAAAWSAQKLSNSLAKIGVNHNVVTFNLGAFEIKPYSTKPDKTLEAKINGEVRKETRCFYYSNEPIVKNSKNGDMMHKFLAHGREGLSRPEIEKLIPKEHRLDGYISEHGTGWNSDAEALKISRELLLKQIGTKILIHLSDGSPQPFNKCYESPIYAGLNQYQHDLKHEVEMTIKSKIELYSIGIMSTAVKNYYPKDRYRVINSTEELYPSIIALVKKNLKRG